MPKNQIKIGDYTLVQTETHYKLYRKDLLESEIASFVDPIDFLTYALKFIKKYKKS